MVMIAAGDAAAWWVWAVPVPAGRPRNIQGPGDRVHCSDAEQISGYLSLLEKLEAQRAETRRAEVIEQADRFVAGHLQEITRIAERLYLHGRAYVPALPKLIKSVAHVAPLPDISRIAACGERNR